MSKHNPIKNLFYMDNKYTPLVPKLDFIKNCDDKICFINDNFNCLLKRSKEQMLLDKINEEMQKKQLIDYEKIENEKRRRLELKKKKLAKKHQLILSSYNNKMILDMILSNKKFIRYITEQQKRKFKNIKTETNYMNENGLNISNKNINKTESNKDSNQNNQISISTNRFKNKNKNINSEYFSTQNSELNTFYSNISPNETNSNIGKNQYTLKNNKNQISFPISSSIFKTSLPIENTKYSQTPNKSVLYLHKNTKINDKFKTNIKERLMTEFNNSYNNYIIHNKKSNLKKYKPFLTNNDNENIGIKSILESNKKNIINKDDSKNNQLKEISLFCLYNNNITTNNNKKKRPLTSCNFRNKSCKNKS